MDQYIKEMKEEKKRTQKQNLFQSLSKSKSRAGVCTIWRGRTRRAARDSGVGYLCSLASLDHPLGCRHFPPAFVSRVRQALKHNREKK